jgi:phospholipase/carboxylesterase
MMTGLAARIRPARGSAEGALVLIHGRGADENNLFPLADVLDPNRRLQVACPRGPLTLAPGGAHWYVVRRVGYPDPATFHPSFLALETWLTEWLGDAGISHDRAVLGGFSQGAVMAYSLALGPERPRPAGVMALSGFIPEVTEFDLQLSALQEWPVAIGHGSQDPIIAVEFGRSARDRLAAAGAEVDYFEAPVGHTIPGDFVGPLRDWLASVLPPR